MPGEDTANPKDHSADSPRGREKSAGRTRTSAETVARALAEVEQTLNKLKALRAEREESEARFKAERAAWEEREAALARERDESRERAEALAGRIAEFEAASGQFEALQEQSSQRAAEIDRLSKRVEELQAGLDNEQLQHQVCEEELARAREQAEQLGAAASELDAVRAELAESRAELDRARAELNEAMASREDQGAELETVRRELESLRASHEALSGERAGLESSLQELRAQLAESQGRVEQTNGLLARVTELEASLEGAERRVEASTAEAIEHMERASALEKSLEELRGGQSGELAELSRSLEAARGAAAESESRAAALAAERDEARAVLDAQGSEVAELQGKLDAAADKLLALKAQVGERDRLLQERAEGAGADEALLAQLDEARQAVARLERERDELASSAASVEAPRAARSDAWTEQRRARLRRYRRALRERTLKIEKSGSILDERLKQCEDVLARRRELAEARSIIERTHKKVVSGRARSGAAATMLFGVCFLFVLMLGSWMVTDHLVPATYAASAVVEAEFADGAAGPGGAEEWQRFHEAMLLDPQFLSRLSERMSARGFAEYGAPAVVKAKLERDLSWSTARPGHLAFELRGEGREKNARMLETYANTLVFESNALRQRRQDAAQTVLAQRVQSGAEPIEDPRLEYAAIGGGCASLVGLGLWFGIWRRMVRAKAAFEHATQIDHLLEDAQWVDPIQQIINARGEGALGDSQASAA